MIRELRETTIEHISGRSQTTVFSSERRWMNVLLRLRETHPDEMDCVVSDDGESLIAHVPAEWIKLSPKRRSSLTPEQREAAAQRLRSARNMRTDSD